MSSVAEEFLDTISSPPPAYTLSSSSHGSSEVAGHQTHSRKAPSNSSGEATKTGKFRSYLASNANQRSQQGPENALRSSMRADRTSRTRANLRVMDEERRKLRVELYQNSLLSREQGTDPETASNPILQRESTDARDIAALCEQYEFSIGDPSELQDLLDHIFTAMSKYALTYSGSLFHRFYLLRNAILKVYHNCRRLQTAELAGRWFSMLVLGPPSYNQSRVATLSRVEISDVWQVVERLSSLVNNLQTLTSEDPPNLVSTSLLLEGLCNDVHRLYRKIFGRLGLKDFLAHGAFVSDPVRVLEWMFYSQSSGSGGLIYLEEPLAQWWCATRALDAGVVAYENGHVSNVEKTCRINLGTLKYRVTPDGPEHSKSLQYVSRGLSCLAGFFQEHDVWVLAMEEASNDLYLATDIETFADVWGPVWKVADQFRPDLIAKYNVRGGSIVPWPSDPDIHPKLRSNERLCHWKSNDEYIHHRDADSANVGMSSILASCSRNSKHSG